MFLHTRLTTASSRVHTPVIIMVRENLPICPLISLEMDLASSGPV